ncbi:hypothetical protein PG991_003425 [Apiospora marii]|uniref:Uncharacterized protein n=1 Tax=Apiospora marii TaxID=335849 RepID=A0ABR1S563_9PEZI
MPISPKSHVRARQTPLSNTNAAVLVLRPRRKTVTAEGLEIEVPRTYHSLVVHVKYRCGHQPPGGKGGIPATIKLRGDDDPHAGPCLPETQRVGQNPVLLETPVLSEALACLACYIQRPRKQDVCWTVLLNYRHCWHGSRVSSQPIAVVLKSRDHEGDRPERCLRGTFPYNSPYPCDECKMFEWRKTTLSDSASLGAPNREAREREEFEKDRHEEVAALVFAHDSILTRVIKIFGVEKASP